MHESTSHYFLCGLTSKRDDKIPFGMESLMEEFLALDASVECKATGGASIRVGIGAHQTRFLFGLILTSDHFLAWIFRVKWY